MENWLLKTNAFMLHWIIVLVCSVSTAYLHYNLTKIAPATILCWIFLKLWIGFNRISLNLVETPII